MLYYTILCYAMLYYTILSTRHILLTFRQSARGRVGNRMQKRVWNIRHSTQLRTRSNPGDEKRETYVLKMAACGFVRMCSRCMQCCVAIYRMQCKVQYHSLALHNRDSRHRGSGTSEHRKRAPWTHVPC